MDWGVEGLKQWLVEGAHLSTSLSSGDRGDSCDGGRDGVTMEVMGRW